MNWHHYVTCFFAGLFLANAVPHYVKGICGDRFPTPFAKPRGKGLSSPLVNLLWSLLNLLVGAFLFQAGQVMSGNDSAGAFFAGIAFISIGLSVRFTGKLAE